MIRLFNVYYPTRTLALLLCEALLVGGSFLLAATCACLIGPDGYVGLRNDLVLEYEACVRRNSGYATPAACSV